MSKLFHAVPSHIIVSEADHFLSVGQGGSTSCEMAGFFTDNLGLGL